MSVTVYEIPLTKWDPHKSTKPDQKVMDNSRVVASGYNHEEALNQLIAAVNEETVDDVNCYLYLNEEQ